MTRHAPTLTLAEMGVGALPESSSIAQTFYTIRSGDWDDVTIWGVRWLSGENVHDGRTHRKHRARMARRIEPAGRLPAMRDRLVIGHNVRIEGVDYAIGNGTSDPMTAL